MFMRKKIGFKTKLIGIWLGNPFKRHPTNIHIYCLGFGISFFGGWKLAISKIKRNPSPTVKGYEHSVSIVWHSKH